MNNDQLQAWIEQISLRDFGVPFRHRARFNSRLRTTGGVILQKPMTSKSIPRSSSFMGKRKSRKSSSTSFATTICICRDKAISIETRNLRLC